MFSVIFGGNSMCAAKVLFLVHVVPQPSLWMLSQRCALQTTCASHHASCVMPWLTIPTITGNKFPNLALLWPHKQRTKTFVLLQMDCLKIIFLATICISVENVHIENWHLLWNALRSISNPKIIRNSFILLGAALCNRRHKYKIGEYWRTSWPLLLEVGLQDDFRLASKIFK